MLSPLYVLLVLSIRLSTVVGFGRGNITTEALQEGTRQSSGIAGSALAVVGRANTDGSALVLTRGSRPAASMTVTPDNHVPLPLLP